MPPGLWPEARKEQSPKSGLTALSADHPPGSRSPMHLLSCFSPIQLSVTPWTRLLCRWDPPGQNPGGGCRALLWGSSPPRMEPAAPGAPASQVDSLRLSLQGRPAVPQSDLWTTSLGPQDSVLSRLSQRPRPRPGESAHQKRAGPGEGAHQKRRQGRERALTGSAGRGPRCAAAVRLAAPPPGSARYRAWCHSAQSWCPRLQWPPCRRERRLHLGLEGRGQLGARRGVLLSLRNTPSPGSPPGPGKGPAP